MPKQGVSRAEENKRIRQDALREQLSQQKHIEQVVKNVKEIESLTVEQKGDSEEPDWKDLQLNQFNLQKLKVATELRLKLVSKYLPDLKQQEIDLHASITELSHEQWLEALGD